MSVPLPDREARYSVADHLAIGVIPKSGQLPIVEEFFELFKTPWELHRPGRRYHVVIATAEAVPDVDARLLLVFGSETKNTDARHDVVVESCRRGIRLDYRGSGVPIHGPVLTFGNGEAVRFVAAPGAASPEVIRVGYDLFDEVQRLLSAGQPVEHAHVPSLDMHIAMLRDWILNAGIPLVEIPPVPAGHSFISCLTHDIDFVGIRRHLFDWTMFGFLYRSTIGAIGNLLRRRIPLIRLLQLWRAAASLPFVYLGWASDFWEPFDWYLRAERGLPATYFLIPFKRRAGDLVPGRHRTRRATAYDITDLAHRTATLMKAGCEIGVHGIDAWHSVSKGRDELARVTVVTGESGAGTRSHWLLHDEATPRVLEEAGYVYDSTIGYNETVGYRAGTTQVFRPLCARALLELPLHIQDGALFYPSRLDLSDAEAEKRCRALIGNAERFGGVLTVLWHDRSHGPERFWGHFYIRFLGTLRSTDAWFGTASQVVDWFRHRREVQFESVMTEDGVRTYVRNDGDEIRPPLRIRVHHGPSTFVDLPLTGRSAVEVDWSAPGSPS